MKLLYPTLAAALCAACLLPAAAQAPASTPSKTGTLGETKSTNAKILTRDELRSCMKRQEGIRQSRSDLEAKRSALDAERAQIEGSAAALSAERSTIEAQRSAITALSARFAEHKARIEDWNVRMVQLQERRVTERAMREMDLEKKAIEQAAVALEAERATLLPAHEAAVQRYNSNIQEQDQRARDWNARSGQRTEAERNAEVERLDWMDDCSGRRFREDDEAAIRAGK
jgi:chromosome segregation ATPase